MHKLNEQIYEYFDYKPKSTKVDSPIDLALGTKAGVCQDFAHIMIALVRSKFRIPCRYVSGYLFHGESDHLHGESDHTRSVSSATHAWIEAFVPPFGWVGFDPTNWLVAGDRHIRTAIGRDYGDVPPTHGIFRGRAASELTVAVRVTPNLGTSVLRPGVAGARKTGRLWWRRRPSCLSSHRLRPGSNRWRSNSKTVQAAQLPDSTSEIIDPVENRCQRVIDRKDKIVTLAYKMMVSPVGALKLVASDMGLVAILWNDDRLGRVRLGDMVAIERQAILVETERQLGEYFAGKRKAFSVALDMRGTRFQRDVWEALLGIPFGETRSYGQLARQLGNPRATRAVGAANGRNPLSIIVPCHRVIGSSGKLTGFAGGLDTKAYLLRLER